MDEQIDFATFQYELDQAFHSRDDPYPAGSSEHADLVGFVQRLHKLKTSK